MTAVYPRIRSGVIVHRQASGVRFTSLLELGEKEFDAHWNGVRVRSSPVKTASHAPRSCKPRAE